MPFHPSGFLKGLTMTTMLVTTPAAVAAPRAAAVAANLFSSLLSMFERVGQARAQRRLLTDRAAQAASVRAYAMDVMHQDRRFAADLLAAADRHETT
jgi:hypothetical protein